MLLGITVFLFWYQGFPHALSYQEQYQLFLWNADYFCERMSVVGGMADWLGEFITQFYYVEWLGAACLAFLFVILHLLVWGNMRPPHVSLSVNSERRGSVSMLFYPLSMLPCAMLLWLMGDVSVLLSYVIALIASLGFSLLMAFVFPRPHRKTIGMTLADALLTVVLFWLFGFMAWLYVGLRIIRVGWKWLWMVPVLLITQWMVYRLLTQWPVQQVFLPMTYYRIPLHLPWMIWLLPVIIICLVRLGCSLQLRRQNKTVTTLAVALELVVLTVCSYLLVPTGYDKEMYELIRQDYLVRNERWDEIIDRAQRYQVHTPFSSVCVNLALSQKRQLADRMFDFYQSGEDALIMPRIHDMTSMLPSMEVFWRLGMVNSAQRYAFDSQASILNARNSGRLTRRIAECMLVNGHYGPARKQLELLSQSLYYADWADEKLQSLKLSGKAREQEIEKDAQLLRVRNLRFKNEFLYNYEEMDKMLGLLFIDNTQNLMALDYMLGQILLGAKIPEFQQYLGWAQQYGNHHSMPRGYQDVVRCIQNNGKVSESPYRDYIRQKTGQ